MCSTPTYSTQQEAARTRDGDDGQEHDQAGPAVVQHVGEACRQRVLAPEDEELHHRQRHQEDEPAMSGPSGFCGTLARACDDATHALKQAMLGTTLQQAHARACMPCTRTS